MLSSRVLTIAYIGRHRHTATFLCHQCFATESSVPVRTIDKLLIANRGEIACRVMRTAKRMGIRTIAVYSEADARSMHTLMADEAYCIGPAPSSESYLCGERIIETAHKCGAQAIHPGYGFLSENAQFAEDCMKNNVIFVGPPPSAIRDMGIKNRAKRIMEEANVPVVKGYHGEEQNDERLRHAAEDIGYPVMLKAVYGGGGKGMRIALDLSHQALDSARSEAKKAFGNDDMIVEKFVERPRHVEVQVFGDQHGNYVYLYERDCSVQRRHQKIIEEAPAPLIAEQTRKYLGEAAVRAAHAVGYYGAGTVEFIMDPMQQIYFMEMNTRLQVEHPVSELITGTDLVEWQLRVAQGLPLPIVDQKMIPLIGHAFECRVYAEDDNFMPQAGTLHHLRFPTAASVRVETGVNEGDVVSVHYDPMIAKLCVHAHDRTAALTLMRRALGETRIVGMPTNVDFMNRILAHEDFVAGNVYTDFIPDRQEQLFPATDEIIPLPVLCAAAAARSMFKERLDVEHTPPASMNMNDPFNRLRHFRVNLDSEEDVTLLTGSGDKQRPVHLKLTHLRHMSGAMMLRSACGKVDITFATSLFDFDDTELALQIELFDGTRQRYTCVSVGDELVVYTGVRSYSFFIPQPAYLSKVGAGAAAAAAGSGGALAPMPGVVDKVLVEAGQNVKANEPMIVMVAMKMEYIIRAPKDGIVKTVRCKPGDNVDKNAQLVEMQGDEEEQVNDERAEA